MFPKNIFGCRVAHLRNLSRLSQEQLGREIKVTKATISRIESADRAPSVDVLFDLADYFDVSIDYLVGRSDNPHRR